MPDDAVRPALLAEFSTADDLLRALRRLRARGCRALDAYSPYPIPGADEWLGIDRSPLPRAIFLGGLVGGALSYLVQWYTTVISYPLNIGARPVHAVPAFLLITFEGTILGAALTAFFGLFVVLRLPRLWHPVFEIDGFERATADRFWVVVALGGSVAEDDRTARTVASLGALRVVRLGEGAP